MTTHTRPIPKIVKNAINGKMDDTARRRSIMKAIDWIHSEAFPKRYRKHREYLANLLYRQWDLYGWGTHNPEQSKRQSRHKYILKQAKSMLQSVRNIRNRGFNGSSQLNHGRFLIQTAEERRKRVKRNILKRSKSDVYCGGKASQYEIQTAVDMLPTAAKAKEEVAMKLEDVDIWLKEAAMYLKRLGSKMNASLAYREERATPGTFPLASQLRKVERSMLNQVRWRNRLAAEAGAKEYYYPSLDELYGLALFKTT